MCQQYGNDCSLKYGLYLTANFPQFTSSSCSSCDVYWGGKHVSSTIRNFELLYDTGTKMSPSHQKTSGGDCASCKATILPKKKLLYFFLKTLIIFSHFGRSSIIFLVRSRSFGQGSSGFLNMVSSWGSIIVQVVLQIS